MKILFPTRVNLLHCSVWKISSPSQNLELFTFAGFWSYGDLGKNVLSYLYLLLEDNSKAGLPDIIYSEINLKSTIFFEYWMVFLGMVQQFFCVPPVCQVRTKGWNLCSARFWLNMRRIILKVVTFQ